MKEQPQPREQLASTHKARKQIQQAFIESLTKPAVGPSPVKWAKATAPLSGSPIHSLSPAGTSETSWLARGSQPFSGQGPCPSQHPSCTQQGSAQRRVGRGGRSGCPQVALQPCAAPQEPWAQFQDAEPQAAVGRAAHVSPTQAG